MPPAGLQIHPTYMGATHTAADLLSDSSTAGKSLRQRERERERGCRSLHGPCYWPKHYARKAPRTLYAVTAGQLTHCLLTQILQKLSAHIFRWGHQKPRSRDWIRRD